MGGPCGPSTGSTGRSTSSTRRACPTSWSCCASTGVDELIDAIQRLAVRGAPALGVAGAFGVALLAARHRTTRAPCAPAPPRLREARPTAVNLAWGVDRALACRPDGPAPCSPRPCDPRRGHRGLRGHGQPRRRPDRRAVRGRAARDDDLQHRGAGGGRARHRPRGGRRARTRAAPREALPLRDPPLLQGARLTAWELARMGAPFRLVVDGAAAPSSWRGGVDARAHRRRPDRRQRRHRQQDRHLALAIAARTPGRAVPGGRARDDDRPGDARRRRDPDRGTRRRRGDALPRRAAAPAGTRRQPRLRRHAGRR